MRYYFSYSKVDRSASKTVFDYSVTVHLFRISKVEMPLLFFSVLDKDLLSDVLYCKILKIKCSAHDKSIKKLILNIGICFIKELSNEYASFQNL